MDGPLKVPRVKGFVVKSAKTTDLSEARRFAEELYFELEGRTRRGEPIRSLTFKRVLDVWTKALGIESDHHEGRFVSDNIRRLQSWPLKFLGDYAIDLISEATLAEYLYWRTNHPERRPAVSTLKNERTALNHLFRFAKLKGYMRDLPGYRIKAQRPNPRPDIPDAEWMKLCQYLQTYVSDAPNRYVARDRLYLQQFVLILGNTGIRIGEARRLRWRDVSSTRTLSGDPRVVLTVRGKTGERAVVANAGVEGYLKTLWFWREDEIWSKPPLDEFVFCHDDGSMIGSFKRSFRKALEEAGILYGSDGKRRVPYSLRHTYATMRISEGVNVFQLAANMGTSVEMIEDFYGKKRVRDPKMATEITKYRER